LTKTVEDYICALRVLQTDKEIGEMNKQEILDRAIPNDIHKAREGFYLSASDPSVIWFNPSEILESLGEPSSPEMLGAISTSMIDAFKDQGIEAVVITDG
jgi:hypothetical protein